jgi:hypothetical protein
MGNAMVQEILIAAMFTLAFDGTTSPSPPGPAPHMPPTEQVPAPTQSPSRPAQISMKAADWNLQHSSNVVAFPSPHFSRPPPGYPSQLPKAPGWQFNLPTSKELSFRFLATTASPPLIQGWYLKMAGSFSNVAPVFCRMYFKEVGDDFSGQGQYAYYRWWSTKIGVRPAGFIVGLEPDFWSTAMEERGDASPAATAGFQQALANPQSIGIMCDAHVSRGPFARDPMPGDGIDSYPQVYATFTMDTFAVCDPSRQPWRGPFRNLADADSAYLEYRACAPPALSGPLPIRPACYRSKDCTGSVVGLEGPGHGL